MGPTRVDVDPAASVKAFGAAPAAGLPDLHLLRLALTDRRGRVLSRNTYWRCRTPEAMQALTKAKLRKHLWIEELIDIAEDEASCELYGILKRPDEKYVTERAYDNPKFVEDLVRDVAKRLNDEERIGAYVVEAENFESIHNHSAYALIERDKDAEK